ncbi:hypothetical protein [Vibrio sp. WXL210]|uniref:hypothetical protein n=1 Tax=Vibrio sp. WXL210 TaxID=3450709 RepID=UPI003EC6258D
MKRIISLGLAVLLASTNTFACGFHDGAGALDIPNYPGIMFTLARIKAATDVEMISEMEKPAAMLNWQLAQQLRDTMPVDNITFYQVIEGHYSTITNDPYRWLNDYSSDTRPALGELMILSELSVLNALLEGEITIDKALEEMWIKVNGPREQREAVTQWLRDSFV